MIYDMATMAGASDRGGVGGGGGSGGGTSRSLHNFALPPRLSWGTQRLLRCSKSSPSTSSQNDTVSQSPSKRPRRTLSPQYAPPFLSPPRNSDRIEVVREQLMVDLRSEVDKMRANFMNSPPPPPLPPPPKAVVIGMESRPWNLRTRRGDQKSISSPVRDNVEVVVAPPTPVRNGSGGGEVEVERARFSVALSRQDIEDDFMEMVGRRPPRKPKKRPRYVQKQLDTLFPGLWLSEITADMYKVNEIPEPPK